MLMSALLFFVILGAALGALLGMAATFFKVESNPLVDQIEGLLPGGQCGQCGEAGCRQAAEKIVSGELHPDCCPPGGSVLAATMADILGVAIEISDEQKELVAVIEEAQCSGCHRCVKACPFDAIVGAPKQLHTVIKDVCTGCQLCSQSCPQHCLTMEELIPDAKHWYWPKPTSSVAA
ncbi:RnfABCDGE type electron transport complex subunit B [Vibrio tritonius]|uniref:RnfABCDGE type electron transport complex subunit B n=1 Tax=Vibrio tritonius TaxID=1435069 RepID=UPI00315DFDC9